MDRSRQEGLGGIAEFVSISFQKESSQIEYGPV
jgi:hypothetical protein